MRSGAKDEVRADPRRFADHGKPCPECGGPGIQVCAGCRQPSRSTTDCGCPCGTYYLCMAAFLGEGCPAERRH
jgi:hypothetical protein